MAKKFLLKSSSAKKALEKQNSKQSKYKAFKFKEEEVRVLVLPKIDWDGAGPDPADQLPYFQTVTHEVWNNGRLQSGCASPEFSGEEDKLVKMGWDLRERYQDDRNDKKKEFFKLWLPKQGYFVNVIDLDDVDAGPQVMRLNAPTRDEIFDMIKDIEKDCEDEDALDFTPLCDLDEGAVLQIRHNGKDGLLRKYKAKFLNETANLLKDGIIDEEQEEKIIDEMYDLTKLQRKFDEDEYEKHYEFLLKKADKLGVDVDGDFDDEDDEFEESDAKDDDEFDEDEKGSSKEDADDDFDDADIDFEDDDQESDEEDFEDDDFEDEEEEEKKPAKKSRTSRASKEKEPAKKERPSRSSRSVKKDSEPAKKSRSRKRR